MSPIYHRDGKEIQVCTARGCGYDSQVTIVPRDGGPSLELCRLHAGEHFGSTHVLKQEVCRWAGCTAPADFVIVRVNGSNHSARCRGHVQNLAVEGVLTYTVLLEQYEKLEDDHKKMMGFHATATSNNALLREELATLRNNIEHIVATHGTEDQWKMLRATIHNNHMFKYAPDLKGKSTATLAQGALHGMLRKLIDSHENLNRKTYIASMNPDLRRAANALHIAEVARDAAFQEVRDLEDLLTELFQNSGTPLPRNPEGGRTNARLMIQALDAKLVRQLGERITAEGERKADQHAIATLKEEVRVMVNRVEEADQRLADFRVFRQDYPDVTRTLQEYEDLKWSLKSMMKRHCPDAPLPWEKK